MSPQTTTVTDKRGARWASFPAPGRSGSPRPRGHPVAPRRGAALISSNGSRTRPVLLGPARWLADSHSVHVAIIPPPAPAPRLRPLAGPPIPEPAMNFSVGRRHGTAHLPEWLSFTPFSGAPAGALSAAKQSGESTPVPRSPRSHTARCTPPRHRAPLAHPPWSSNFVHIKLTAKLASSGGGAFGGRAPRRLSAPRGRDRAGRGGHWPRRAAWCRRPGVSRRPLAYPTPGIAGTE